MVSKIFFRLALVGFALIFAAAAADAKIITKTVPYQSEGMNLKGYLAYDDAKTGKHPVFSLCMNGGV